MYRSYNGGVVEVTIGPMFSGKSQLLIRRITLWSYGKLKTLVVKPAIDNRWSEDEVISRSGASWKTTSIDKSEEIIEKFRKDPFEAIAIDEAQFFDDGIIDVVKYLSSKKIAIFITGLDADFQGKPFKVISGLVALADKVSKVAAVCLQCGSAGTKSFRKNADKNKVSIGDEEYEARCTPCFIKGQKEKGVWNSRFD